MFMKSHLELSDNQFESQFENYQLPPSIFTHEAHLRLAWIHIKKYGVDVAINNIKGQIKNYVRSIGEEDKYNETLTVAAIRIVYHFIRKTPLNSFQEFLTKNQKLKTEFRELIFKHYKTNIFSSEIAKREFLEPELLPFS